MAWFGSNILVPQVRFSLAYSDLLLKGIPASDFARLAKGIETNHPAFVFGHLSLYPDRLFEQIGRSDLVSPDTRYADLFSPGKPCLDDPTGTIYPPMNDIVERFRSRYTSLLGPLGETPDDVFQRPNPSERMRDRLPTLAAMASFYVSGHVLVHLGQVSAWRRIMGLGSAM